MNYQMQFIMIKGTEVVHQWECTDRFGSKEDAMRFAQNVAKGFNGSQMKVYYRIVH